MRHANAHPCSFIPIRTLSRTLCCCALALTPAAPAQEIVVSPEGGETWVDEFQPAVPVRRVIRVFDFEEPNNPNPVPMDWLVGQSPNDEAFPLYNKPRFDATHVASGERSVRLPTQGGSTRLTLRPTTIPIFAEADYAVAVRIRTEGLVHARAVVSATLLDIDQEPIPNATVRSPSILAEDRWREVSAVLPGGVEGAAFLRLDLELLQPKQLAENTAPDVAHRLWKQDLAGSAWFDDVSVFQVPRVEIATQSPSNVITAPESPKLNLLVRDLAGDTLELLVEVRDDRNTLVDRYRAPVGRIQERSWRPALDLFGWYTATLRVLSEDLQLGVERVSFVYLPPRDTRWSKTAVLEETSRFGILASTVEEPMLSRIPPLALAANAGFITLPAMQPNSIAANAGEDLRNRRPVYDALLERGVSIALAASRTPAESIDGLSIDTDDVATLFAADASRWLPLLLPSLDFYGQRILKYQLGDPNASRPIANITLSTALQNLQAEVSRLVPSPTFSLAWRADRTLPELQPLVQPETESPADQPSSTSNRAPDEEAAPNTLPAPTVDKLTLLWPAHFVPNTAAEILERATSFTGFSANPRITLGIESLLGYDTVPEHDAATIAKKMVYAWEAAANYPDAEIALALSSPWSTKNTLSARSLQLEPRAELAAFRTVASKLAGREVVGRLPLGTGLHAFILATPSIDGSSLFDPAIVLWNESAPTETATIQRFLGGGSLTITDIFGNESDAEIDANQQVRLTIPRSPIFIEGINPYIALFLAGARIDPAKIPSIATRHDRVLVLDNPWPQRIGGQVQLRSNREDPRIATPWEISPRGVVPFSIEPKSSVRIPVSLTFGPAQEAGDAPIELLTKLTADRTYPTINVDLITTVGLDDIELRADAARSPDPRGPNIAIFATITNRSQVPRALRLEARAPGLPTKQINVSELGPGDTETLRIIFHNAAEDLAGKLVRVTVADTDSPERLVRTTRVP